MWHIFNQVYILMYEINSSHDDIQILGMTVDFGIGETLLKMYNYLNLIENYNEITNEQDLNPFQLIDILLK